MFNFLGAKETKWEKLEAIKLKKLEQKNALMDELQKNNDAIMEAILNERATDDLTKAKNTLQEKIRNIEEELQLLEAEQSKARIEHYQTKIKLIEDQVGKKLKELEPHRIKYEKAKEQFKEIEAKWFHTHWLLTAEIGDLERKKSVFKSEIDHNNPDREQSSKIVYMGEDEDGQPILCEARPTIE